uniref:Uncharacterized protein n=1 Tax=Glossina austeni TaxID=7395 RepID=A0A1A9UD71_GLOAU
MRLCIDKRIDNWYTFLGLWPATKLRYFECEVPTIPLSFAFRFDLLLAVRCAEVINNEGYGRNGRTLADTRVSSPSILLTLVILSTFIITQKSLDNNFAVHVFLYSVVFGLVAAKVTSILVIARMSKAEMEYLDWSLLGPILLQITLEICAHLHVYRFTIPYPSRTTGTQGTSMNTNSTIISSSNDKNSASPNKQETFRHNLSKETDY